MIGHTCVADGRKSGHQDQQRVSRAIQRAAPGCGAFSLALDGRRFPRIASSRDNASVHGVGDRVPHSPHGVLANRDWIWLKGLRRKPVTAAPRSTAPTITKAAIKASSISRPITRLRSACAL